MPSKAPRRIGLVYNPVFLDHRNPPGHPERVERLSATVAHLSAQGLLDRLEPVAAPRAERAALERVHTAPYLDQLDALEGESGNLDPDTYFSTGSVEAAYRAAGGGVALTSKVHKGELDGGFALLRPPGHHAEADRAMGFCLLNNVAVAAAALRADGVKRVAILDWDVHHGNGTQHMFEADPAVLYLSTHQAPFYPGTGAAGEIGRGPGAGTTVNFPMPGGCGDVAYLDAFDTVLVPILEQFRPEILLVSAGFDAYVEDPLASMRVTTAGYAQMAQRLRSFADRVCGGRIVYFLEGGYDLDGLAEGVEACILDLLEPAPLGELAPRGEAAPPHESTTPDDALNPSYLKAKASVIAAQKPFWKV
jgi:acetoin utilization deacetylase AcuC-like enzyme